ncbi:MAG TPA: phosphatase PAP2 family protein [Marmoricola sp.]|nr:phosphatase PAP2 family protein [Marmoricola sp.]
MSEIDEDLLPSGRATMGAGRSLRVIRWLALGAYLVALVFTVVTRGAPLDREAVMLWVTLALVVASIGRRPIRLLWLVLDFLPFVLVLLFYDYLRGLATSVGLPTWWSPQIHIDRFLFFGHVPTVWLQEHLKHPRPFGVRWYDVVASLTYYSFFLLPYVTAGVLWLRGRADFHRWAVRFVGLSFLCFGLFVLIPAAPPWAAGHCTATDVTTHPSYAPCMDDSGPPTSEPLLGDFTQVQPGANPWVERIAGDGLQRLHLDVAPELWRKGFSTADPVAAMPSLHLAGIVLFCLFLWRRVGRTWKALLVLYPFVMMFSLAYTGEHYVADGIAGALVAWLVHATANRLEPWWLERRRPAPVSVASPAPSAVAAS